METTGADLFTFLDFAAAKGLLKPATAHAHKASAKAVLSAVDDPAKIDLKTADVDDLYQRFANRNASLPPTKRLSPTSLESYRHRTRQAVKWFLDWSGDQAGWRPNFRVVKLAPNGKPKKRKSAEKAPEKAPSAEFNPVAAALSGLWKPPQVEAPIKGRLAEYAFPLREGQTLVRFHLPVDLKLAEARKLSAFLELMAVDAEPTAG